MSERSAFNEPLWTLEHGHGVRDWEVETLYERPVSSSVGVEEGLMIMISKLVHMTRSFSPGFSGSPVTDASTFLKLAEDVREQSQILTNMLFSLSKEEKPSNSLARLPFHLERVAHMLKNILDCHRAKTLSGIRFSDKAHREQQQIFALLLDILNNLRDALQNPRREALLAVLLQGKRLEQMIVEFNGTHGERLLNASTDEGSIMWHEILASMKWANAYLMQMASNLLYLRQTAESPRPHV